MQDQNETDRLLDDELRKLLGEWIVDGDYARLHARLSKLCHICDDKSKLWLRDLLVYWCKTGDYKVLFAEIEGKRGQTVRLEE